MGAYECGSGLGAAVFSLSHQLRCADPPSTSLRFAEFMFEGDNFLLHFAQFQAFCCATRFVKQVNKSAGKTADENDHETQRPDENSFCFQNATETVEHDLQNFFAETNSGGSRSPMKIAGGCWAKAAC